MLGRQDASASTKDHHDFMDAMLVATKMAGWGGVSTMSAILDKVVVDGADLGHYCANRTKAKLSSLCALNVGKGNSEKGEKEGEEDRKNKAVKDLELKTKRKLRTVLEDYPYSLYKATRHLIGQKLAVVRRCLLLSSCCDIKLPNEWFHIYSRSQMPGKPKCPGKLKKPTCPEFRRIFLLIDQSTQRVSGIFFEGKSDSILSDSALEERADVMTQATMATEDSLGLLLAALEEEDGVSNTPVPEVMATWNRPAQFTRPRLVPYAARLTTADNNRPSKSVEEMIELYKKAPKRYKRYKRGMVHSWTESGTEICKKSGDTVPGSSD